MELNIEDFEPGIYLITAKSATINKTKKLVITH
jgi:hypothetical protein